MAAIFAWPAWGFFFAFLHGTVCLRRADSRLFGCFGEFFGQARVGDASCHAVKAVKLKQNFFAVNSRGRVEEDRRLGCLVLY